MKTEGLKASMELLQVGLDKQVPHMRKFERVVHQQWQKVCETLLLGLQRSHQDKREACWGKNLPENSKRREGIGEQKVPRLVGLWPWHIQRKLGVCSSGKEGEPGTAEHNTDPLKYPLEKGPFHRKNLVGMGELTRQNVLLPQNAPRRWVN